ncbi:hypothetical protein R3W88_027967 [Solanum pinnatisectum]|uniref:Transcription repressor n=1 Tax=Solanum pinnatisectum TaxID=50273 RepID=A0AAV9LIS7_9SOLN|nr:hypothetical protein R3W88_027967 [Solanum pinnatisectum]
MKLSSLFKKQKKTSFSPLLCPLPHCGNSKTLSFRVENNHNIFNSQRFYNNVDDDMVDKVIEGLTIEKGRFFFEAGEKTSSILEVLSSSTLSKSTNNNSNGVEYLPFNESCVIKLSSSKDPYGSFKKSMVKMVEANQGIKDWDEFLEETLAWYLEVNEKKIHKYIIGAFCDLWISYSFTSTTNTPNSFSFSSSEPKAEISTTPTSNVIS